MWGKLLDTENTVKAGFLNQTTFFFSLFSCDFIHDKTEKMTYKTLKKTLSKVAYVISRYKKIAI